MIEEPMNEKISIQIQTEDSDNANRLRISVYDKIENSKRCELIRMVSD
jgi:hypothetical protein